MKRTALSKTGKSNIAKLKRKLDIAFSKMIRERDKGDWCIDGCGRKGEQAGHFRRRELMSTRWNPMNVNAQNTYCNAWDNDGYRHAKGIDVKWGKGTAEKLEKESRKIKQWKPEEIKELITFTKNPEEYNIAYYQITKQPQSGLKK